MSEDSRGKFVRLAEKRVNSIIKTIRLLGNLSNKSNYSYTENDVEKIFRVLDKELKNSKNRFQSGTNPEENFFSLD